MNMRDNHNKLIEQLLENFAQQRLFYEEMVELAHDQNKALEEKEAVINENVLTALLGSRLDLMEKLDHLNQDNRALQQKLLAELGMQEFVMSQLKGKIPLDQWQRLQEVLAYLGQLLQEIAETDAVSQKELQQLIRQRERIGRQVPVQHASSAYQQTMDRSKKK